MSNDFIKNLTKDLNDEAAKSYGQLDMGWKVGDKVRLTGTKWGWDARDRYYVGAELEVMGVNEWGNIRFNTGSYHWGIGEGWEIELVEREENSND